MLKTLISSLLTGLFNYAHSLTNMLKEVKSFNTFIYEIFNTPYKYKKRGVQNVKSNHCDGLAFIHERPVVR